jgi:4-hydroxy-tetrahydrodipicolinate reductase
MERHARERAIVTAANFSFALTIVARFVRELAARADAGWGAGVVDVHFAGKRDLPSGTARALADAWSSQRGAGAPVPAIASFRIGDAVSEHRVLAAGTGEQVEICHRVNDRAAFVPGVLAAIRFAEHADPGLYSLEDAVCV